MKLNQVNILNNQFQNKSVKKSNQNVNFKGIVARLGDANKGLMQYIENGGFFAEFCIMDLCGLVLPRVWQGFNRNKEELGHWNIQAGTEELLREGITGPSMFLIPIGAVLLAGRCLGKGTQINSKLLTEFSSTFKKLGTNLVNSDLVKKQKDFAGKLFDDIFVNNNNKISIPEKNSLETLDKYKEKFIEQLTSSLNVKLDKKTKKTNIHKFNDLIADINASYFDNHNSTAIVFDSSKKLDTSATDLYLDARKYLEDVIPSTEATINEAQQKGTSIDNNFIENTINGITKIRENGRKLLCLGGTASLAAFLSIIPKIYQISKTNPALNGMENNGQKEVANA